MELKRILPILNVLPDYTKVDLKGDLTAGITVGVMLIPQGMAYALLAGLPPIYGLYTAMIPLLIYGLLGTSRQMAVGPVAMVALLVGDAAASMAAPGTDAYIDVVLKLSLMTGILHLLMAALRLGYLVNFLSHPVISGFTSAAAIIILLSQVKHFFGIEMVRSSKIHEILHSLALQIQSLNPWTLGVGIVGVMVIVGIKKMHKTFPAQIMAVVVGVLLVWGLSLTSYGVKILGEIPSGFPPLRLPSGDLATWWKLLPMAVALALVSYLLSISIAKTFRARHRNYSIHPNQELFALGTANVLGSLFGAFPVAGGFSRSAVNDQAGSRSGFASIMAALLVMIAVFFFTPLFYFLPKTILAAVIIVAVYKLIDIKEARKLWSIDKTDFSLLVITFVTTLTIGIEQGLVAGMLFSLLFLVFRSLKPHVAVLGRIPDTSYYRNVDRFDDLEEREDVLIVRFDAQLYFANTAFFLEKIEELVKKRGGSVRLLVFNFEGINHLDTSAIYVIEELIESYQKLNIQIFFVDVKGPVRDKMYKSNLIEVIGQAHFFLGIDDALAFFDGEERESRSAYTLQKKGNNY